MAANATGSTAIMVGRCIMFLRKKKVSQIEKQKNRKLSMEIVRLGQSEKPVVQIDLLI